MRTRLLQPEDKKQWDELVKRSKNGSFFHTYDWLKFLEKGLKLEPFHIVIEKNGNIIAGMPNFAEPITPPFFKRLISLPLFEGALYLTQKKKENLEKILTYIKKICRKFNFVSHRFITTCLDYCQYSNYLGDSGYKLKVGGCRFVIKLGAGYSRVEAHFFKKRKYDIRRAKKFSIEISDLEINEGNIKIFYNLYLENVKRIKSRPLPWTFFQKILLWPKDNTRLFMAKINNKFIAGFLHFFDPLQLKVHHCFSVSSSDSRKYKPDILLHLYSIQWAIKNGYHYYDMGGSSFFDSGVFKFKEQWGGEIVPNLIWERDFLSPRGLIYKLGKKIHGHF